LSWNTLIQILEDGTVSETYGNSGEDDQG